MGPLFPRRILVGTGDGVYYRDLSGSVQKMVKPIVFSPVESQEARFTSTSYTLPSSGPYRPISFYSNYAYAECFNGRPTVDNICYDKMLSKIRSDKASAGILLAEHKAARDMITRRSRDLVNLARAVAKRSPTAVFNALESALSDSRVPNVGLIDRAKWVGRTTSSLWLELSWGWRPAIEDIYNSIDVLCSPIYPRWIRTRHSETGIVDKYDNLYTTDYYGGERNETHILTILTYDYVVKWGLKVLVNNENVALANRLGLINPFGIAWAVQPFSFLIDKYVNIGQMINSLTDLYGFTISDSWVVRSVGGVNSQLYALRSFRILDGVLTYDDTRTNTGWMNALRRQPGQLKPVPALRPLSIGSFDEAASYFALLTQILLGKK